MNHGFQELKTIVPKAGPKRLGYVSEEAFETGSLAYDGEVAAAVDQALSQGGICLLLGRRSRGKTVFAKTYGLRFLHYGRRAHAYYAHISDLHVPTAVELIRDNASHRHDKFLFVVEDCHADVDKSVRLLEALHFLPCESAQVLATSREIGSNILFEQPNPASDLRDRGLCVDLRPGRTFLSSLVRKRLGRLDQVTVADTVARLVSLAGDISDLGHVARLLDWAAASHSDLLQVDERDLYRGLVDGPLADAVARRLLLPVAALNVFDVGAPPTYLEHQASAADIDRLVNLGLLRRTGNFRYWLEDPSQAEAYVAAGRVYDLFAEDSEERFMIRRATECLSLAPAEAGKVALGIRTELGADALKELFKDTTNETLLTSASRSSLADLGSLFRMLADADKSRAKTLLSQAVGAIGDTTLASRFETSPMASLAQFASTARALQCNIVPALRQYAATHSWTPAELAGVPQLAIYHPEGVSELIRDGLLHPRALGASSRDRSPSHIVWTLLGMARLRLDSALPEFIQGLGGHEWFVTHLPGATASVSAWHLRILRRYDPATYKTVMASLPAPWLKQALKTSNLKRATDLLRHSRRSNREAVNTVLSELSVGEWTEIVEGSTVADHAKLLIWLRKWAPHSATVNLTKSIELMDWAPKLRDTKLNTLTLFVGAVYYFSRPIWSQVLEQLAEMPDTHFDTLWDGSPEQSRLTLLSILLARSATHQPASLRVARYLERHIGEPWTLSPPAVSIRNLMYRLRVVAPSVGRRWLASVPDEAIMNSLGVGTLFDATWAIWNCALIDKTRALRLLAELNASEPFVKKRKAAPLRDCLVFGGMSYLVGGGAPTIDATATKIASTINGMTGPNMFCFGVAGMWYGCLEPRRTAVSTKLPVDRLRMEFKRMRPECPPDVYETLHDVFERTTLAAGHSLDLPNRNGAPGE